MSTVLVGIDEAGYGPTLGPLCVGMTAMRVPGDAGSAAPDLWKLLGDAVTREPGRRGRPDARGRIAIADSKRLKLPNSVTTTHPLVHLERGVLAFLGATGSHPDTDDALLAALRGGSDRGHACYAQHAAAIPCAITDGERRIAASSVAAACSRAGVEILDLRCRAVFEAEFNTLVRSGGKAQAVVEPLAAFISLAVASWAGDGKASRLGIVCDRLGGRATYVDILRRAVPGGDVEVLEESPEVSRYVVRVAAGGEPRRAGVMFLTESEDAHLGVALASMTAKYVRELLMSRFNRYFSALAQARGIELKPTAGYALDARRWLTDAGAVLTPADREHLVRIA